MASGGPGGRASECFGPAAAEAAFAWLATARVCAAVSCQGFAEQVGVGGVGVERPDEFPHGSRRWHAHPLVTASGELDPYRRVAYGDTGRDTGGGGEFTRPFLDVAGDRAAARVMSLTADPGGAERGGDPRRGCGPAVPALLPATLR